MDHLAANVVFLAATNFLTSTMGFFYRLVLAKHLGPEVMGIYQQTLAFFGTAITVITAGIPVSVSKLVAENDRNNTLENTLLVSSAFGLTTILSLFGLIFLIGLSQFINSRLLLIVLPAAVFVGYSSVIKGYFFGIQYNTPVLWSNISECVFRTIFGAYIVKTNILLQFEGETRGAVSALTVSEFVSLCLLYIFFAKSTCAYRIHKKNISLGKIKDIITIAIPVSFSRIVNSLSTFVKALLVPKSLVLSGLSSAEALGVYGKTSGMVLPLLFFPSLFIRALASNIIPQISKALSMGKADYAFRLSQRALFFSSFFSFAVTGFFIALSKPVADLLFPGLELGNLIIGFAAGIPFFYTESALIAVLRGMGNNVTPIVTSIGSFFITNAILYILVAKTLSGIYGYAIALITASSIAVCISISKLEQMFCKKFNMMDIALKPMLCCVFMVYILNRTYSPLMALGLPNLLRITASLLLGLGGYLLLALTLGINLRNLTL